MIKDFNKDAIICGDRHISYKELLQRIRVFGNQFQIEPLFSATLPAQERQKVLIYCKNREGFIYAFFSVWLNRSIAIPVDVMSSVDELVYILNDCKPGVIWTSLDKIGIITTALQKSGINAQVLIIDNYEKSTLFNDSPVAKIDYENEQTAIIIYTSGTTGSPKGVMLSFKNLFTNIRSVSEDVAIYRPDLRALILLPLHHVLPLQGCMIAPIVLGAGVAISPSMTAQDIMKTLAEAKVGLFIGVPRLWQTLYNGIMNKINASPVTRGLYKMCEKVNSPQFSRKIFKKIHDMMGGNLKMCPSGGSALDPEIWKGLRVLGLEIIEGYGMTECAPIITFSRPGDLRPGCVGKSLPSCQVSIINGEICAKGDNIMQGYYNRPEETAQVIDDAGWLHSGDIGYLDDDSRLYITGRKKEIIVLPNGKNVNPSELEAKLEADTLRIKEAAVIEECGSLKAIICPQMSWASGKSITELEELLKRDVIERVNASVAPYKKLFGVYVYYGELPRTRMDKIQRFKLCKVIEECKASVSSCHDNIDEIEPNTEEYKLIVEYICKEKKLDVRPHFNIIFDLGFDSLDLLGLVCFIEQTFGINITQEKILSFPSIDKLAAFISHNKTRMWVNNVNWVEYITKNLHKYKTPQMDKSGWMLNVLTRGLVRHYFRLKVFGKENIPKNEPFIMVSNHQSYFDALFLLQGLNKKQFNNLRFFAKEEHVNNKFVRYMARHHGVIVLQKEQMKESIGQLGKALHDGYSVLIFPEGTITQDGQMKEFRPTFSILSMALNIPVLPVCIDGAFKAFPKYKKIPRREQVSVTYFPLIRPNIFKDENEMTQIVYKCISEFNKKR